MRSVRMESVQEMWDQKAELWAEYARDDSSYWTKRLNTIVRLIQRHMTSGRSLDVGCGPGLLCALLADSGFDVYGADISAQMVRQAVHLLSGRYDDAADRVRVSGQKDLPFSPAQFDVVTGIGVLEYIQERPAWIRQLQGLLKPGGYLLLSNSCNTSLFVTLAVGSRFLRCMLGSEGRKTIQNLLRTGIWSGGLIDYESAADVYSPDSLDRLIKQQGLTRVDWISFYSLPFLDRDPLHRSSLGTRLARSLGWNYVGLYQKKGVKHPSPGQGPGRELCILRVQSSRFTVHS